jgi:hypothetical protein
MYFINDTFRISRLMIENHESDRASMPSQNSKNQYDATKNTVAYWF